MWRALEDAAHVPAFAWLGWALWHRRPQAGWGAVLLTALAAAIEVAQAFTGRDPGIWDAILSALGGTAGLAIARARSRQRGLGVAFAWAGFCAVIALAPALGVWTDRRHARAAFPVLADFATVFEFGRWTSEGVMVTRQAGGGRAGRAALRMEVVPSEQDYPGVFMSEGLGNWTGYERLLVNIFSERDEPILLWIRIDDRRAQPAYQDRAQQRIELAPGWNEVSWSLEDLLQTPSGRALDRARLTRLGFFFDQRTAHQAIRIDHLRLD